MGSEIPQIHVFFFPFMAHGHMIPAVDIAKLFSTHGVKTTIITTPLNASYLSKTIERSNESGLDIGIKTIKFPSAEAGLAEGIENADSIQGNSPQTMELLFKFFKATSLLQEPFQQLLQECKPDCLVSDMFFPWSTDVAIKLGIPNLVFHGTSAFAVCAMECVRMYEPYKKVESDIEPFVIPNLPGDIKLTKQQIPDFLKQHVETNFTRLVKASKEAEKKSYGVIVNSFYELEKTYADYYRNVLGRRTWHIGPVSLCNRATEDKAVRGKASAIDEHECLKWLDTKKPNSVIYICFGSMANFTSDQLKEIAIALESSEQQFIWVVRRQNNNEEDEDWLPDQEYEKRMEGKGLIIRGWAPQVLILDHEAIGGFVTHCGWNSTLEGVCAGVPMVTWPVGAEQFYNEKLLTDVLKIGVSVGAKQWKRTTGDFVRRELIEKAVREIMKGDEVEEMRKKAKALAEEAKKAVEMGGSSYSDLNALIEELSLHRRH